jgi:two-component system chemotaxis response regulator CheB
MRSPGSSDRGCIRVLVVDDSAVARTLISEILSSDPKLEIVGSAVDGRDAIEMVERLRPSVITMDLVMPRVDGLEAIRRIMAARPTPIVVVASPQASDRWVFQAMEAGAVTVLEKPAGPGSREFTLQAHRLVSAVKVTAGASVTARRSSPPRAKHGSPHRQPSPVSPDRASDGVEIVAVAASTGGPPALAQIVRELPADVGVPLLLVQHIAAGFELGLARWIDEIAAVKVRMASHGEPLRAGEMLVAPAGMHLGVSARRTAMLNASAPIAGFRPSATFLFRSVAAIYGGRTLGVVLTGMGSDGAEGLLEIKQAGGSVIVQDEATSAVYGMPRAAVAAGVADRVLPLADIGAAIATACGGR